MVTVQQIDESVFVVGRDDFKVVRQSLEDWLSEDSSDDVEEMPAESAREAWDTLRLLCEDCLLWQCGACDEWLFTSDPPRIVVLRCSRCDNGGVDFQHAGRHVGG